MITNFFKPANKEMQGSIAKSKPEPRKPPKEARKRRCALVDSEAELSGDGHSGRSEDEWSDDEKERQEKFISDEPVREKRKRLPRVSAAEKVVSEDELENLKDDCLEIAKPRKKNKGYADEDDLKNQSDSDCSWISDSEEVELAALERQASSRLRQFVEKRGVGRKPPQPAPKKARAAEETAKAAEERAKKFKAELSECQAKSGNASRGHGSVVGSGFSLGSVRVREMNPFRQLASIFQGGGATAAAAKQPPKKKANVQEGLVMNPVTKEVCYQHKDGRLSPRPGAL